MVTWNVSTHAPPEASVNVDGPSVWKVSKSNLKAQISKKGEEKMSIFLNMYNVIFKQKPIYSRSRPLLNITLIPESN